MESTRKAAFALLLTSLVLSRASADAPVCLPGDVSQQCQQEDSMTTIKNCALYYAESAVSPGTFGLFSGVERAVNEFLILDDQEPELMIPILDANLNEWSPWHDMVSSATDHVVFESNFLNKIFKPGISSMITCSNKFHNVQGIKLETDAGNLNNRGVHRSKDPIAGSFSYYSNSITYQITQTIQPGEEFVIPCGSEYDDYGEELEYNHRAGRKVLSKDFLQETGICLLEQHVHLQVAESTIAGAGRGVFVANDKDAPKAGIPQGSMILASPVIQFDRSQVEMLEQTMYPQDGILPESPHEHNIQYTASVWAQQLLLNYCFGNIEESDVLLLPFGPMANFINHNRGPDGKAANAYVRWSIQEQSAAPYMTSQRPMELFSIPVGGQGTHDEVLILEYVALRDIQPGEEIFIDYGDDWVAALEETKAAWKRDNQFVAGDENKEYMSAADFAKQHKGKPLRTIKEEKTDPYPENLAVACYFVMSDANLEMNLEDGDVIDWSEENFFEGQCFVPCEVHERTKHGTTWQYNVMVYPSENVGVPEYCRYVPNGLMVNNVPAWALEVVDQPYTSDTHLSWALRHEIGLPEGFFPEAWESDDPNPYGDFTPIPLQPGELANIYWKDSSEKVTDWAFRLGLSTQVREVLLEYCEKMGITEVFRHVTSEGNGLKPGTDAYLKLHGLNWYLQRPEKKWYSNLHWLSPADNAAHEDYLQALGAAGFDEMLKSIGETLNMDGLVAFHVTFIAVSQSTRGYVHKDVGGTGAKVYNVIIPLELASETAPELDLQDDKYFSADGEALVGRYRYEYNVGAMMGDDAMHGTSAVDYRQNKEMRLAATVYIADVNESNIRRIMSEVRQNRELTADHSILWYWAMC